MDSEHQRRKRKRISRFHCLRSLLFTCCFIFLAFFSFSFYFSDRILIPSTFSIFSFSTERFRLNAFLSSFPLRIEDRVLFPDYLLLLLSSTTSSSSGDNRRTIINTCVYFSKTGNSKDNNRIIYNILSAEEHDERRLIVRCPLPPENYSAAAVNLQTRGRNDAISSNDDYNNNTVHSWETIVYAAVMYDETVVVFVKGLNLRSGRESDPSQLNCHFGLGNWERSERYVLTSKAITAAQEVVRCLLPRTIQMNPDKADGIRVTIGMQPQLKNKDHVLLMMPSVAKMFKFPKKTNKYNLCVCTMVWNQASSLREWIIYHSWLGVERWFIYDNNSDDEIKDVIKELQQEEDYNITRHVWPWIKTQEAGFSHCAMRSRDECSWVGFFDVDEFFYFPHPNRRKHKPISNLGFPGKNSLTSLVTNISSSSPIAEIRTACHSFGPSGLNSLPSQGVTIGYTCRLQSPERHKSIVRPEALDDTLLNVVHHFRLRKGYRYLNLPQSTAVINHYKYQVWEAFRAKFYRRVATYVVDWRENQNEGSRDRAPGLGTEAIEPPNWPLQFCEVWDTGLKDFMLTNLADPSTGLLPWEKMHHHL
ncbi:glycosyltransferase family 92 protein RCOM_0530710-like [Impatiens glandulifera]|uniref:glycosyltransferase family 92 protein RCOM_0530710-like n=1 Tax=Impatiens glandulifera TaxID=253017 RepID=UPI001FB134D7|nr:glycosyltransferase family 92 protein RCOM_0530710-like [Impatiens glandulifera]